MGGAALVGAVVVGANPTHRGDELARDLSHTECQLLVTDADYRSLVAGHDLGPALPADRILVIDDPSGDLVDGGSTTYGALLGGVSGAPLPEPGRCGVTEESLGYLLFTSGTSGAPKACLCSQGRLARIGSTVAQMFELTADDVCYLAMPLFHSNALMAGWAPALAAGADRVALRERFSASQFLPDVRRYGVTYFNYVGKPLSYILATPDRARRRRQPAPALLRQRGGRGRCGAVRRSLRLHGAGRVRLHRRRGGRAAHTGHPARRPRAGPCRAPLIINPETGEECPRAAFDEDGRLLNAEEAIGEMVSQTGAPGFEGYWRNGEAERARIKNGWYWTGDLAYRDADDFFYFGGRGLRLAARRRRELRRRAGRGDSPAPPRRGAGLGLRRPGHRGRAIR